MDRNISTVNDQLTSINIYLDLSIPFDSVDNNILADKLQYYGVQDASINLLKTSD